MQVQELVVSLKQELRRGTLVLIVLSQLAEPQYGYSLVTILEEKGVPIDPGTLYPLLRRLEKQGLLESKWDTRDARPRKYYLISDTGREVYEELRKEWLTMRNSISKLTGGES